MQIKSERFGDLSFEESRIIKFNDGLLGFPDLNRYVLVDNPNQLDLPFKWLVSVDNPEIGFLVTDPGIFFSDYVFDLEPDEKEQLHLESEEDVSVITLLTVPQEVKKITANLRGPLVINWKTFEARQIILKKGGYTTKHYIFAQPTPEVETSAPLAYVTGNHRTSNLSEAKVD